MAESKVMSLRVNDKTKEIFKNIADEIGGNQDEILTRLCNAYSLQKDKVELPEDRQSILEIEQLTEALTLKFIENIKAKATLREKIQQDFIVDLKSKDEIIKTLQTSIDEKQIQTQAAIANQLEAESKTNAMQEKVTILQKELEEQKEKVMQKDELIQILKSQVSEIEHIRESMRTLEEVEKKFLEVKETSREKETASQKTIQELQMQLKDFEVQAVVNKTEAVNQIREKYEKKLEKQEQKIEKLQDQLEVLRKKGEHEV